MADTSAPALRPGGGGHWVTISGHPVFLTGPAIPLGLRPAVEVSDRAGHSGFGTTTAQAEADLKARGGITDAARAADRIKADGLAKEFGFPPERVHLNYGTPDKVVIGGHVLGREAGHYDQSNGQIVIAMQASDPLDPGTMAHEVMHAKYQRVIDEFRQERAAYAARFPGQSIDAPLSAANARAFPTLAALHGDLEGDGLSRLVHEDGISQYSHDYWVEMGRPLGGADLGDPGRVLANKVDTALTETQAEWNRMEYETSHGVAGSTLANREHIRAARPHQYKFFQHLTSEYARLGPG